MVHSRRPDASAAELVLTQVLQGMGGGFAAVCSTVASQAAVPHVDMAITTAMVLLWTEIGGAVGSAVGALCLSLTFLLFGAPLPSPLLTCAFVLRLLVRSTLALSRDADRRLQRARSGRTRCRTGSRNTCRA